jgi:hypothetical protein
MTWTDWHACGVKLKPPFVVAAILFALTSTSTGAKEDVFSANFMLQHCRNSQNKGLDSYDAYFSGACNGSLQAIFFMLRLTPVMTHVRGALCIDLPKAVTWPQVRLVVIKYIEERPERMHESFLQLASEAMIYTWPCKD